MTNTLHTSNMALLTHIVVEPFNGETDYTVVAAFDSEYAAQGYTDWLNANTSPDVYEYPYSVVNVGSLYRDSEGKLTENYPRWIGSGPEDDLQAKVRITRNPVGSPLGDKLPPIHVRHGMDEPLGRTQTTEAIKLIKEHLRGTDAE